ncbi:MAG TPA: hypothetical protein VEC96_09705, partial [Anaerolineae bacterium]|nr:hypothetical protein [Anaerolineae bacterium]
KAPAKPKAAGGGSKGASEKRQENREKFIKMPPSELNGVNAKAFLDFADGGDLGPDEAKRLAGKGLVEFGDDGKPRLTSTGRGLLAAMNAGDRRRVQDALSRGQDKANKLVERYKEFAAQAQELGMQVEALANEILNLEQLINQSTDANEREVLLMQLEKFLVKQAKLEEATAKAQARAAEVGRRLGLEGPDEAKEKSLSSFRSSIRANVRGLWNGSLGLAGFRDGMTSAIERGFNQAWAEGAKACGLKPDEYSDEEKDRLRTMIEGQQPYIIGFGLDIQAEDKAGKFPVGPHFDRAEMWVNGYNEVVNQARAMACKDLKLKWVYGDTQHCSDCSNLNGRVYRASTWHKSGLLPQSRSLACSGYRCKCSLQPTDEALTKGRPPKLAGPRKKR